MLITWPTVVPVESYVTRLMFIAGRAPGAHLCRLGQEPPDLFQHRALTNLTDLWGSLERERRS